VAAVVSESFVLFVLRVFVVVVLSPLLSLPCRIKVQFEGSLVSMVFQSILNSMILALHYLHCEPV
jgi:hypothetical protein